LDATQIEVSDRFEIFEYKCQLSVEQFVTEQAAAAALTLVSSLKAEVYRLKELLENEKNIVHMLKVTRTKQTKQVKELQNAAYYKNQEIEFLKSHLKSLQENRKLRLLRNHFAN